KRNLILFPVSKSSGNRKTRLYGNINLELRHRKDSYHIFIWSSTDSHRYVYADIVLGLINRGGYNLREDNVPL
ncbi:hypothetical protein KA005_23145, partial [bacterium]|nr:hypothetical protein [bacterium]